MFNGHQYPIPEVWHLASQGLRTREQNHRAGVSSKGYVPELRKDKNLQLIQENLNMGDTEDSNSIGEVKKIRIKLVFYSKLVVDFKFFEEMISNL